MPKQSYIRVSHVYEISYSLLRMTRVEGQSFCNRISRESYYHLMEELDLHADLYRDTSFVIHFGATIRREDTGPSLNGSSSGEMLTPSPDQDSSGVTSSSELPQALTTLARSDSQVILNSLDPHHGTIISAFDPSSTHESLSALPTGISISEQTCDSHGSLHSAVTSPHQVTSQLHQLRHPPLDLKKALTLLSNPLSRFPHYLLKAILLIGTQPWGKLCLYSLVMLACYYTGTLKFGFLAIKGLDGWLDNLGNWSVRGNFDIVKVLGGLIKFLGRLTSPVLMRVVKVVGGLLKDVGLWAVRRIVRRR